MLPPAKPRPRRMAVMGVPSKQQEGEAPRRAKEKKKEMKEEKKGAHRRAV